MAEGTLFKGAVFTSITKLVRGPAHFKSDEKWAKDWWKESIVDGDQDTLRQMLDAAAAAGEILGKDGVYEQGLCGFLKGGWRAYRPGKPERDPPAQTSTETPADEPASQAPPPAESAPTLDDIDAAFAETWLRWPKNKERPEREVRAHSSWRAACRRYGLPTVLAVTERYMAKFADPARGMVHPRHLGKLLSNDEEVETELEAIALAPSPRDLAEYAAVYHGAYPDFGGKAQKEALGLEFWRRHIAEADRFLFLLAARRYGLDRTAAVGANPEAGHAHTLHFNTFVGQWRDHDVARELDCVAVSLIEHMTAAGRRIDDFADRLEGNIGAFVIDRKLTLRAGVEACIGKLPPRRTEGLDHARLAESVVEAAYVLACKKLGFVIESRLDASRPGDRNSPTPA